MGMVRKISFVILAFVFALMFSSCSNTNESISVKSEQASLVKVPEAVFTSSDAEKKENEMIQNSLTDIPAEENDSETLPVKENSKKKSDSKKETTKTDTKKESPETQTDVKREEPISPTDTKSDGNTVKTTEVTGEVKAFWISYLEYGNILTGKSKDTFTQNIRKVFTNLSNDGYNTVFVHARSHGDAYYNSDIFPWSKYASGTESKNPGFDPLQIMIEEAHKQNIKIEAWINPYRVKVTSDVNTISTNSPAYKWIGTDKIKVVGNTTYFNPADDDVIDLIVKGVEEIVRNYDIDGIHFDDYFYPTKDASFDKNSYETYLKNGGSLDLAAWRRDNVNRLIKNVYSAIKNINSNCKFGISPSGNISQNYNDLYCDVYTWTSQKGYIDYLCPQIYYGFENGSQPFLTVLQKYNEMIKVNSVDLYVGLAAYKCGAEDTYAGSGKNEWINNSDILAREIESARNVSHYKGFALYRYDSIYNPDNNVKEAVKKEKQSLDKIV